MSEQVTGSRPRSTAVHFAILVAHCIAMAIAAGVVLIVMRLIVEHVVPTTFRSTLGFMAEGFGFYLIPLVISWLAVCWSPRVGWITWVVLIGLMTWLAMPMEGGAQRFGSERAHTRAVSSIDADCKARAPDLATLLHHSSAA